MPLICGFPTDKETEFGGAPSFFGGTMFTTSLFPVGTKSDMWNY